MSSRSAGRVSDGGLRNCTAPPGSDIARKNAASMGLPASRLLIQDGRAPLAEIIHPVMATHATIPQTCTSRLLKTLGEDFNLHLLGCDVLGDVFGGYAPILCPANPSLRD